VTVDDVRVLFQYDDWANALILNALVEVPAEQYLAEGKSSHGGLHGTAVHLIGAEKIWLDRWLGDAGAKINPAELTSLQAVRALWDEVRRKRDAFLASLSEAKIRETFTAHTSTGGTYVNPYWQTFQHLVNHSSYHRGQIVTLLRQIGVKPPATDLIRFYREQQA